MLLKDKTILVTGAGRGIGFSIVGTAVRERARVIAHVGRATANCPAYNKFDSNQVLQLTGDLSLSGQIDRLWEDAPAWQHRIDVLVNNSGVYSASPLEPLAKRNGGWNANIAINLQAPANLCRHAIQHFEKTQEGIIINMASRSSHRGDDAEYFAYGAVKGGLLALTKGIARSYAASGTLAYAIAPAWVRTEMAEAYIATVGANTITAELPMRKITPASDAAETVVSLASGRARYANGCTIDIAGADNVR